MYHTWSKPSAELNSEPPLTDRGRVGIQTAHSDQSEASIFDFQYQIDMIRFFSNSNQS